MNPNNFGISKSDTSHDLETVSSTLSTSRKRERDSSIEDSSASDDSSIVIVSSLMASCAAIVARHYTKHRRLRHKHPLFSAPLTFGVISDFFGPEMFKRTFRMTRSTFRILLGQVGDLLIRRDVSETPYRRKTVPADIRLCITLRILAGASYCDLSLAYQIKTSTIFDIFVDTCAALIERLRLEGLPRTKRAMGKIAKGFQTSRKEPSPIFGCVGALDGICIKIKKPSPAENPASFYSRKGFYALPVQALSDSNYMFRYCSIVCTGATHDALAYAVSGLKRDIDGGILGVIFFIVGDEAYVCTEELIVPFPAESADFDQMNFNYFLSSLHIHIEQAFGLLVARWRILRGGLEYSVKRSADIICLLMKLHNFCIRYDGKDSVTEYLSVEEKEQLDADTRAWYAVANEISDDFRSRAQTRPVTRVARTKRDALVEIVKQKNMRRPTPVPLTVAARRM